MIFDSVERTHPVKVVSLPTIKSVAYILGMPPQSVSNFYHNLIKPRKSLEYIALFKG